MRCRICRDRSPVGMVLGWRLDGYQIAVALVVAFVRDHPFGRCVSECRGDNGTSVWLERLASMWPFVWRAAWAECRWVRRHAVFRLGMSFAACHRWAWGVFRSNAILWRFSQGLYMHGFSGLESFEASPDRKMYIFLCSVWYQKICDQQLMVSSYCE